MPRRAIFAEYKLELVLFDMLMVQLPANHRPIFTFTASYISTESGAASLSYLFGLAGATANAEVEGQLGMTIPTFLL